MKQDRNTISRVDRGWGDMYRTLEIEMPQKKDRRIIFWIFFGLALSVATFLFLNNIKDSKHRLANSSVIIEQTKDISQFNTKKSDSAKIIAATKKKKETKEDQLENNAIKKATQLSGTNENIDILNSNKQNNNILKNSNYPSSVQQKRIDEILINKRNAESTTSNNLRVNLIEKPNAVSDEVVDTKTTKGSETVQQDIASIASEIYLLTETKRPLIEMNLATATIPVIKPITHEWKTELSLGINSDVYSSLRAVGASALAGIQFRKKKFGLGLLASYSNSLYGWNNNNSYTSSEDRNDIQLTEVSSIEIDPINPAGGFPSTVYTSTSPIEESLSYISLGINFDYVLSENIRIYTSIGRELHLNEYLVNKEELADTNFGDLEMLPEEISLRFNNNFFLESGFSYVISSNFSLVSSYRYTLNNLIDIINFDNHSSKLSMGAKYTF